MIGMSPKDAIELREVPLDNRENYPPEDILPEDGLYIIISCNLEKNTMINAREPRIEYGLSKLIG